MAGALRQLFALSESYPDLKANVGFVQLQTQLEEIEDHIAQSRRYYNAVVRDYNTAIQVFPGNVIAGSM
jgi:LemA protein